MIFFRNIGQVFCSIIRQGLVGSEIGGNSESTKRQASERILAIETRMYELEKKLTASQEAGKYIVGGRIERLEAGMGKLDVSEISDPEADKLREDILKWRSELFELEQEEEMIVRRLEITNDNKLSKEEVQKMKIISNKEFLSRPFEERLKYITRGNLNAIDVATGKVDMLEFTFTFDGQFNSKLHERTTAGQVLPEEVREVYSNEIKYTRKGINGEFFSNDGKRLVIHEATKIGISKVATKEEIQSLEDGIKKGLTYNDPIEYEIAINALRKGFDPKFAILAIGTKCNSGDENAKKATIEDMLTDFARLEDDYRDDYGSTAKTEEGKNISEAFAGYIINNLHIENEDLIASHYGYNVGTMHSYRRTQNPALGGGPIKMENINIEGMGNEEIKSILQKKKFVPGTKDAQILFTVAAKAANLPEDWGTSYALHSILGHESNGVVGRLNYTIKGTNITQFKTLAINNPQEKSPTGALSSASGLGQLLLSNVDKYYPDGRNGIGDALNEAVGMLRYIKARYGSPDVAFSVYGKIATYTHAISGMRMEKRFKEGY